MPPALRQLRRRRGNYGGLAGESCEKYSSFCTEEVMRLRLHSIITSLDAAGSRLRQFISQNATYHGLSTSNLPLRQSRKTIQLFKVSSCGEVRRGSENFSATVVNK